MRFSISSKVCASRNPSASMNTIPPGRACWRILRSGTGYPAPPSKPRPARSTAPTRSSPIVITSAAIALARLGSRLWLRQLLRHDELVHERRVERVGHVVHDLLHEDQAVAALRAVL